NKCFFANKHAPIIRTGHPAAKWNPCQIKTYDLFRNQRRSQEELRGYPVRPKVFESSQTFAFAAKVSDFTF
ncbi:MAG: hypothetical protein FWD61_13985, partial [Phycisphaerales bacterium]|nr:hypothetical protein [Phycisphaerales bacterium]